MSGDAKSIHNIEYAFFNIFQDKEEVLMSSSDGGKNWEKVHGQAVPDGICGNLVPGGAPDELIVACPERNYISRDLGKTWIKE